MKNCLSAVSAVFVAILISTSSSSAELVFSGHTIARYINSWSAFAEDVDGDGDIDVVASGRLDSSLIWWENDGDQNFTEHVISSTASYAMGISVIDLDTDGDVDVVAALQAADELVWYENDGHQRFTERTVSPLRSPSYVYATDVDSDGDVDVLAAACEDDSNRIAWYENDGSQHFTEHIVKENWDHANSVYATDVDSDGDVDILGTASGIETGFGEIAWFENNENDSFTEHIISSAWERPSNVYASDLDLDGDTDILASVCGISRLVWFENNGEEAFTRHTISYGFGGPRCVRTADLDRDGDVDILGAAISNGEIAWWENDGSQNFSKHSVTTTLDGAIHVQAVDIDRDGDLDILGTAKFDDLVVWWESSTRLPEPRAVRGRFQP